MYLSYFSDKADENNFKPRGEILKDWLTVRNICYNGVVTNLVKFSCKEKLVCSIFFVHF